MCKLEIDFFFWFELIFYPIHSRVLYIKSLELHKMPTLSYSIEESVLKAFSTKFGNKRAPRSCN